MLAATAVRLSRSTISLTTDCAIVGAAITVVVSYNAARFVLSKVSPETSSSSTTTSTGAGDLSSASRALDGSDSTSTSSPTASTFDMFAAIFPAPVAFSHALYRLFTRQARTVSRGSVASLALQVSAPTLQVPEKRPTSSQDLIEIALTIASEPIPIGPMRSSPSSPIDIPLLSPTSSTSSGCPQLDGGSSSDDDEDSDLPTLDVFLDQHTSSPSPSRLSHFPSTQNSPPPSYYSLRRRPDATFVLPSRIPVRVARVASPAETISPAQQDAEDAVGASMEIFSVVEKAETSPANTAFACKGWLATSSGAFDSPTAESEVELDERSSLALVEEEVSDEAGTDHYLAATPELEAGVEAVADPAQLPFDPLMESFVPPLEFDLPIFAELLFVALFDTAPATSTTPTFVLRTSSPLPLPADPPRFIPDVPQPSKIFGIDGGYSRLDREREQEHESEVEDRTSSLAPLPSSPLLPWSVEAPSLTTYSFVPPLSETLLAFSTSPTFPTFLATPPTAVSCEATIAFPPSLPVPEGSWSSSSGYELSSCFAGQHIVEVEMEMDCEEDSKIDSFATPLHFTSPLRPIAPLRPSITNATVTPLPIVFLPSCATFFSPTTSSPGCEERTVVRELPQTSTKRRSDDDECEEPASETLHKRMKEDPCIVVVCDIEISRKRRSDEDEEDEIAEEFVDGPRKRTRTTPSAADAASFEGSEEEMWDDTEDINDWMALWQPMALAQLGAGKHLAKLLQQASVNTFDDLDDYEATESNESNEPHSFDHLDVSSSTFYELERCVTVEENPSNGELVWDDEEEEEAEEDAEARFEELPSPSRPLAALPSRYTKYLLSTPLSHIPAATSSVDFDDEEDDEEEVDAAASFLDSCFDQFTNSLSSGRKRRCEFARLLVGRFDSGGLYFAHSAAKRRKTAHEVC